MTSSLKSVHSIIFIFALRTKLLSFRPQNLQTNCLVMQQNRTEVMAGACLAGNPNLRSLSLTVKYPSQIRAMDRMGEYIQYGGRSGMVWTNAPGSIFVRAKC